MSPTSLIGVVGVLAALAFPAAAGPFVAYSLGEAARRAEAGNLDREVSGLTGIDRVLGMVQDPATGDIVLVGRRLEGREGRPSLALEDLVGALRARLIRDEWPTVSIDPVPSTATTGLQQVNFLGGIEGTAIGQQLLASDVFLKRYSLELEAPIGAVKSYRFLAGEVAKVRVRAAGLRTRSLRWEALDPSEDALAGLPAAQPSGPESSFHIRFWFYAVKPRVVARDGVYCIDELRLGVARQTFGSPATEQSALPSLGGAADAFGEAVGDQVRTLAAREPALDWLKGLFDLAAIAEGIRRIPGPRPGYLAYLLKGFPVRPVETSPTYRLLRVRGLLERSDGAVEAILISGGISLETGVRWLNEGDVSPLREIVLKTRPAANALSWSLPLDGWQMPNAQDLTAAELQHAKRSGRVESPGFSLRTQTLVFAPPRDRGDSERPRGGFAPPVAMPELRSQAPRIESLDRLGGVVVNTAVEEASFRWDWSGSLDSLRQRALEGRSRTPALGLPAR
jgi:hypothetical protein